MTLKIEEGRYYRTRDGRKAGPITLSGWRGLIAGKVEPVSPTDPNHKADTGPLWNLSDGTHGDRDSDEPCVKNLPHFDLIEEWVDEPKVGTLDELKVQIGDRVQYRSPGIGEGSVRTISYHREGVYRATNPYGYEGSCLADKPYWHLISRAADAKPGKGEPADSFFTLPRAADTKPGKGEPGWTGEYQPDETPLDHFGQPANDNDAVPQTSKDAYAEIARSLGHAVMAHVEAGDYEQALKCAALMRRAEMVRNPIVHSPEGKPYFILGERQFSGSAAMSKDDLA